MRRGNRNSSPRRTGSGLRGRAHRGGYIYEANRGVGGARLVINPGIRPGISLRAEPIGLFER